MRTMTIATLLGLMLFSVVQAAEEPGQIRGFAAGEPTGIVVNPANDLILPQFVDSGEWKTSIFLTNLDGTKEIFYRFAFVTDTGNAMLVPIVGFTGPLAGGTGSLPIGWSVTIETQGTSPALQQGWVVITTYDRPPDQPGAQVTQDKIGGMAIFRQRIAGRPDLEAVVPLSPRNETRFVMLFDNRVGFSTGIAWLNPDPSAAASVQVTIQTQDAQLIRGDFFNLPPGNKLVFSMPERYPETNGRQGRIVVSVTGTRFSALGLRFNPTGAFTSFHALSLAP